MFLEKTAYDDDFPIQIRIVNIKEYPIHYHQDIEIVFVLKGEILLKNGSCTYRLHSGDVFTNSGREVHAMYSNGKENAVAILKISNRFFTHFFPELSKSCYRTYEDREGDRHLDCLRKMLLNIFFESLKKDINYKQTCIDQVMNLIKYLNQYFNLFSFQKAMAVTFATDNPVMIERMSRIINYLYENHARRITLKELADMEHLSTFYLSHMIKESTGMNFREFLCFARIEWSEIDLLGTNKKISAIARDVGFSTTSYYEKYFLKYFHHTPSEHRQKYSSYVESPARPVNEEPIEENRAFDIVKRYLSQLYSEDNNPSQIQLTRLDISADACEKPIRLLTPQLELSISLEDFHVLGGLLFNMIKELNCKSILLRTSPSDDPAALKKLIADLKSCGCAVTEKEESAYRYLKSYGLDSIAAVFYHMKNCVTDERLFFRLRDSGEKNCFLKGQPALLTASGVPKAAYYGVQLLARLKGELISWGRNFILLRPSEAPETFLVAVYNYSDEIYRLCAKEATIHETYDVISNFHDELDISITIKNIFGEYIVTKSSLDYHNNTFDFLSKLGFPERLELTDNSPFHYYVIPDADVRTETADKTLSLSFSIKGVGMQIVNIQKRR